MALGYRIPSTIIYDNTKPASFNTSSSQRVPCFIGLASPYKKVNYESVVRQSSGNDSLAYSSSGVYRVRQVGSQRGLSNFKENTHFQVVSNEISWLPKITDLENVTVTDVITPIAYTVSIDTPVNGENANSGYCQISSTPTPFIAGSLHNLASGTYSLRVAVNKTAVDANSFTTLNVAVVAGQTWQDIIIAINSSLVGAVASIVTNKITFTSSTTGETSVVAVKDGVSNGLIAAINLINEYKTSLETTNSVGTDATSGYSEISYLAKPYYMDSNVTTGLAAATYHLKLTVDGVYTTSTGIVVPNATTTWGELASIISSVAGVNASIVDGKLRISSETTGATSTLTILDGSVSGLISALDTVLSATGAIVAGSAGSAATIGYVNIATTPTTISGSIASNLVAGTYTLQVNVNNGGLNTYAIPITGTETWTQVVTAIDTALALVADASISSGKIKIQSRVAGASSSVVVLDGASSGLLAGIDAIIGSHTPTIEDYVFGANASNGTATLSSAPEMFTETKRCNLPSAVYTLNVAVDGAPAVSRNVTVTSPNEVWSAVVSSLNSALSGATASIVDSKIQIKSTTTGATSSVVITDGSSNGLINALDNLTATSLTVATSTLAYPRAVSTAKIEFTSGVTTYLFTLTSAVVDGTNQLTFTGDATGLELVSDGSILNLSTVGVWLETGATYYVSYDYTRPDSEYNVYKTFNSFNNLQADLGDNIPSNDLVMAANLALNAYSVPMVGVVQIKSKTKTNFLNALETIKYQAVDDVLALSTDSDVRSYVINHVNERSLAESKRNRMAYTGAAVGTPVGDESIATSLRGIASGIKNERIVFVNATRGLYYYNDPDTGVESSTIVDGAFIACAIGAFRDSYASPTTTLLNKTISGITLFAEDYDNYYSEYMLTQAGASSCFLVSPSSAGGMVVIDDLTTDNSTVERNNINIVTTKDYIAKDVSTQMDRVWKGKLITDQADYVARVGAFLKNLMNEYKRNNLVAAVVSTSASLHPTNKTTILIYYSYNAVYTHKYTEGSFEIIV